MPFLNNRFIHNSFTDDYHLQKDLSLLSKYTYNNAYLYDFPSHILLNVHKIRHESQLHTHASNAHFSNVLEVVHYATLTSLTRQNLNVEHEHCSMMNFSHDLSDAHIIFENIST